MAINGPNNLAQISARVGMARVGASRMGAIGTLPELRAGAQYEVTVFSNCAMAGDPPAKVCDSSQVNYTPGEFIWERGEDAAELPYNGDPASAASWTNERVG